MKKKMVLVTGANGFLANNLIRLLLESNYSVRGVVRSTSNTDILKDLPIELIRAELSDSETLMEAMNGCDAVVHLAALTAQNAKPDDYMQINYLVTKTLVMAAKKMNIRRFIYVSTANAFGNGSLSDPGHEGIPFMTWLHDSGYAYSKYRAQQFVLDEVKKTNFPAIVVNPTFMLGPHDPGSSSGKIIKMGYRKRIRLCPPGGKNLVSVQDAARGIVSAIESTVRGNAYILAGENLSYTGFFNELDKVTGSRGINIVIPRWFLITAGWISERIQKLTGRHYAFNQVNARILCEHNYYTARKAIEELKLPQTPIYTFLKEAVEDFECRLSGS